MIPQIQEEVEVLLQPSAEVPLCTPFSSTCAEVKIKGLQCENRRKTKEVSPCFTDSLT